MRTRDLIIFIETSISELEIEREKLEVEYKKKQYTFKKQARKLLLKINWTRGNINYATEVLRMAKIPSKS